MSSNELLHLPSPPPDRPPRRPRSSRRTWLAAALGPAVLWAGACLIGVALLPSQVVSDCNIDTNPCIDASKGGAIFMLVVGMVAFVPIVTAVTSVCAAIGRTFGKALVGVVLGLWVVVSFATVFSGPR